MLRVSAFIEQVERGVSAWQQQYVSIPSACLAMGQPLRERPGGWVKQLRARSIDVILELMDRSHSLPHDIEVTALKYLLLITRYCIFHRPSFLSSGIHIHFGSSRFGPKLIFSIGTLRTLP